MYDILELNDKLLADLRQIAKDLNIKRVESYKKQELIYKILDEQALTAVAAPQAPAENAESSSDNQSVMEKREKNRINVLIIQDDSLTLSNRWASARIVYRKSYSNEISIIAYSSNFPDSL